MPPLAGFLIAEFGWRAAYGVLGALVLLIVIAVTLALVRGRPEDMGLLPDGELVDRVAEAVLQRPVLRSCAGTHRTHQDEPAVVVIA